MLTTLRDFLLNSYLKRLMLIFLATWLAGFTGWLMTGYDQIHFEHFYIIDFGTGLAARAGLAAGLVGSLIYGIWLIFTLSKRSSGGRLSSALYLIKHGIMMALIMLFGIYSGLSLMLDARDTVISYGDDKDIPYFELQSSALFGHYFNEDSLYDAPIDTDEFVGRYDGYHATVIRLPLYLTWLVYFSIFSGFLYILGFTLYLDGVSRGAAKAGS